jgi:uncharacterized membrane protein YfcA
MHLLLITAVAFLAAAVNSIAGGGTFLSFPTLVGIGGLSDKVANMTSTVGLWPGSAASIYAARKDIASVPRRMAIAYAVISLAGGTAGAVLLRYYTSNQTFRYVIPWLLLFATVVFAFSKPIARWAGRQHGHRTPGWTAFVGFVQLIVAIYGGYFGAGIGVLMLAGLSFAGLDNIHQMNGLKVLLATIINGVAATIFLVGSMYAPAGGDRIDWPIALSMALAGVVGGFLGMVAARRIKQEQLRAVILAIGVLLTVVYFIKNYR